MDLATRDGVPDQRREKALAAGVQLRASGDVAKLHDYDTVLDQHEGGSADLCGVVCGFFRSFGVPAHGGGTGLHPILAGEYGRLLRRNGVEEA